MEQKTSDTTYNVIVTEESPVEFIRKKTLCYQIQHHDHAISVGDLSNVVQRLQMWKTQLPRVEPFYAVKCNRKAPILALFCQLGVGFDCASKNEISKLLEMGVAPSRIIFASPCKPSAQIKYAADNNVSLMTFDNEDELYKVKEFHPHAQMVVRILPPDTDKSVYNLGMKFGCRVKSVSRLLRLAKRLGINVVGVSFHIGGHCLDSSAYTSSIAAARQCFDLAVSEGFHFNLLDIGGGFMAEREAEVPFNEACHVVRSALDKYFPASMNVKIIAEPGRCLVVSAFTMALNIIGCRVIHEQASCSNSKENSHLIDIHANNGHNSTGNTKDGEIEGKDDPEFMYYLNDGVHGSFNYVLYEERIIHPFPLDEQYKSEHQYKSSLWGPTLSGLDCIKRNVMLPELKITDWIVFEEMGAYSSCLLSDFNCSERPRYYYIINKENWLSLCGHENIASKLIPFLQPVEFLDDGQHNGSDVHQT